MKPGLQIIPNYHTFKNRLYNNLDFRWQQSYLVFNVDRVFVRFTEPMENHFIAIKQSNIFRYNL